ncbi:DUF4931 domain-containing protein [Metabacillus iocasae]|uniref:Galactose-1-phosphate uridylyltransferase n=1 Tax=Priestia iocasae TaxID=2291674 RepID=A0ABS2QZ40_9BACI|nr:DUF4931 domain-containing protein [Metabacillus iocasae]MBM7704754.1 galactose-1-phosphate uridylyltransferase [Metabacillus iocasae]
MNNSHLIFNSSIGSKKPETIINRQNPCPFCDVQSLTNILDQDGSIIWLENKYPVLQDTYQTVIIETNECSSELSLYEEDHLYKLLSFGIRHWFEVINSGDYQSVIFYKNHGPMSGGSLRHPHMQIIGLKHIDYHEAVNRTMFEGVTIEEKNGVLFNLSSEPRVGFFEFNIMMDNPEEQLREFAHYIQVSAHYVLNHFHRSCTSYNLFFYYFEGKIIAKILPRFATSPLFIGYGIPQVSNKIDVIAHQVKELYLDE